ncbi:MAG TPA: membrane protein insertion efficiency factor YidD [Desulfobulbaceae bacterium]|nr:membrane protein insertion efficiency factor YidD [Desulfobulbaceae bacterium]
MHGAGREPALPVEGRKGSHVALLVVLVLQGYKSYVSPLLPPSCRFTPTCSQYAIEAVRKHGVVRGLCLSLWRLLRCHPFARGGYDPVK